MQEHIVKEMRYPGGTRVKPSLNIRFDQIPYPNRKNNLVDELIFTKASRHDQFIFQHIWTVYM